MGEISRITQQWLQITHNGYYGTSLSVAFIAILDCHQLIYHLVNVTSILWKVESAACVVVIFSHKKWFGPPPCCVLRLKQIAHAWKS